MLHARLMLKQGSYNWPVARLALRKILAELELRSPDHPSLPKLRNVYRFERPEVVEEEQ